MLNHKDFGINLFDIVRSFQSGSTKFLKNYSSFSNILCLHYLEAKFTWGFYQFFTQLGLKI